MVLENKTCCTATADILDFNPPTNVNFVKDHLMIIHVQYGFNTFAASEKRDLLVSPYINKT